MPGKQQSVGAKPAGFTGKIAGRLMNRLHARKYKRIIKAYVLVQAPSADAFTAVLDVGCGGGAAVAQFCALLPGAKICGVDHAPDMVALAQKVNRSAVTEGRAEIALGDAASLPWPDQSFNLVTAFDTINFWPDFGRAMAEISRVLKPDGMLLIVNGYPAEGTRWWDFAKFKTTRDYQNALKQHGFNYLWITVEHRTIIIQARR